MNISPNEMTPTGFEQLPKSTGNTAHHKLGGAKSGALSADSGKR